MSDQLRLWGTNQDGELTADGERIVYFFESGPFVKIGYSGQPEGLKTRQRALQTGNPLLLVPIGSIVVASKQQEKEIHDRCEQFHYRNEWFRRTPALLEIIHDLLNAQKPLAPPLKLIV